ncbi:MAG: anti-sigma factor [Solirubrobacteraceae bacterium]
MITGDCGLDIAAYALGALEPAEADELSTHLAQCAVCRDELAAFEQVAAVLPLSVAQQRPPGRLRRRVLADVRADARAHARANVRAAVPALGLACAAVLAATGVIATGTLDGGPSRKVYPGAVYASTGSARVVVSDGQAQLIVHHLPQPQPGHIYEVWLQRSASGKPQPTSALFGVTSRGDGDIGVPGGVAHVQRVLVTQEPAGGSPVPTSSPVIIATL